MLDGTDMRPLLLIPSEDNELPAYSGTAARMAHGISADTDALWGLTRASQQWIYRCIEEQRILPHDFLGLIHKAPETPGSCHTLVAATEQDRSRIHMILQQLDRWFEDASIRKRSRAQFYSVQDKEDARQGRKLVPQCKRFCMKYHPVLQDCSPGYREMSKSKEGGKPKDIQIKSEVPATTTRVGITAEIEGATALTALAASSSFPTPAPSIDDEYRAPQYSAASSGAAAAIPDTLNSAANTPASPQFHADVCSVAASQTSRTGSLDSDTKASAQCETADGNDFAWNGFTESTGDNWNDDLDDKGVVDTFPIYTESAVSALSKV
jgi:hypothetical protein